MHTITTHKRSGLFWVSLFLFGSLLHCSPLPKKANQEPDNTTADGSTFPTKEGAPSPDSQADSGASPEGKAAADSSSNPTQVPCPPTTSFFRDKLWDPVLSIKCLGCHQPDGAAQSTRLVFALPSEKNALNKNLEILSRVARIQYKKDSILLLRPTGAHPDGHTGGSLIQLGSDTHIHLLKFIAHANGSVTQCDSKPQDETCQTAKPGKRKLRRLSRVEYDNTVRDLLGIPSTWGAKFVADTIKHGFDNDASSLTVSALLADQIRKAADEITAVAMKKLSSYLPCDPQKGTPRNCAKQFIESFGARAFRSPLKASTVARYLKLYDLGAKASFQEGVSLVMKAMLQSPYFLYRQELGVLQQPGQSQTKLTSYEIASELSYFFWGTMPDAALFRAAESNSLQDPKNIEQQAIRLLDSPRSRYVVERFVVQWLGATQVQLVAKDTKRYASFHSSLRKDLLEEARRFVSYVFTQGKGTFHELLTADYSILNKQLARFYGVAPPSQTDASGFGKVEFKNAPRGGLLTLGSVLATHARPNSSSPIHRGLLIRDKFLCQPLPPPPANINAEPPGLDPKKTTRERYAQHSKDKVCSGCHKMIDPIGFAFERYDGIGRYREQENGKPIDVRGEIINSPHTAGAFVGVRELAANLAKSPDAQGCFTLQWMRWAYGNNVEKEMLCLMKKVQADFQKGDQSIRGLLLSLVQTVHFRSRRVDTKTTLPPPESTSEPVTDGGSMPETEPTEPPPVTEQQPETKPPSPNLDVKQVTDSKWQTGYCSRVTVSNKGAQGVTWKVRLKIAGTIKQIWNATKQADGTHTLFRGVHWNATIAPGQSAQFGFCADLP